MFEYEAPGYGFRGWPKSALIALHLFLALPANLVVGFIAVLIAEHIVANRVPEDLVGYIVFTASGFILGFAIQTVVPWVIEYGGRWAWAPPVALTVLAVLWDLADFGRSEVILDFWPGSEGEAAWGLFLILPTLACCFYSLGIVIAYRVKGTSHP